jgi:hypothetical protein
VQCQVQLTKLKLDTLFDDEPATLPVLSDLTNLRDLDLVGLRGGLSLAQTEHLDGLPVTSVALKMLKWQLPAHLRAACAWLLNSAHHLTQLQLSLGYSPLTNRSAAATAAAGAIPQLCCSIADGAPKLRELSLMHLDLQVSMHDLERLSKLTRLKLCACKLPDSAWQELWASLGSACVIDFWSCYQAQVVMGPWGPMAWGSFFIP